MFILHTLIDMNALCALITAKAIKTYKGKLDNIFTRTVHLKQWHQNSEIITYGEYKIE